MRDLLLTTVVAALLIATFKHPVIGAYLWAWLSLMNPHKLTFGFAFHFPFAQACAIVTLLVLLFTRQRQPLPLNQVTFTHLLLVFWMSVTCLFALAPPAAVFERWVFVMKIQLMMFVTLMLVLEPRQLRVLIWVVTFSVGFYGIKGGVFTILTGGEARVWGPPGGMIQGNNELAVALTMMMPMMYYLRQTEANKWLKWVLTVCMVLVVFSILGSQSRGALIAVLSMALVLGLKGKHPVRTTIGLGLLVAMAIAFMPDTWTDRMETIKAYREDQSAMSRLWTWTTLWNAAVDRPLVGAGLQADDPAVFGRYAPLDEEYEIFAGRVFVAHSIYFQMLGEHGFVGLGLFLLLGVLTWRMASRLASITAGDSEFGAWMPMLMRMVQVSLIGYAAGGAFLSLAYLDLPYYLTGYVVLCDAMVRRRQKGTAAARDAAAASGSLRSGEVPVTAAQTSTDRTSV